MAAGSLPGGEARLSFRTAVPPGGAMPPDKPRETPDAPAGIAADPLKNARTAQTYNE